MLSLRTLRLYLWDRHTVAIAAVFALFALLIVLCGGLGSAEVRRRQTASTHSDTVSSSFKAVVASRTSSVAFVALTLADVEALYGGQLPLPSPREWTSEQSAVMARRWHRHFAVGDINLVRVPSALWTTAVVHRWLPYLESRCVDCQFLPVAAADWDGGTSPLLPSTRNGSGADVAFPSPLSPYRGDTGLDVLVMNLEVPRDTSRPSKGIYGGGVVFVFAPSALRANPFDATGTNSVGTKSPTHDGTVNFEYLLAWYASSVDPPMSPPASEGDDTPELRQQRVDGFVKVFSENYAAHVEGRLGYTPRYLLFVAWCSAARTYSFHASPGAAGPKDVDRTVHVLCVHEHELVDVTPAQRAFRRIRDASI